MPITQVKRGLFLLVIILSLNSCATVFNGRFSNVNVQTSRATNLVIEGDTVLRDTNETVFLRVANDKTNLEISTFDSTGTKDVFVYWKTAPSYWANIITGPFYFTGFLVDEITGKKKRYPRNVYIDVDGVGNSYLPYFPMDTTLLQKKNKITFAPFSIVQQFHPAFEFGYERLHKGNFATQVSLGIFRSWNNGFARNSKGFKVSVEEKYFFKSQSKLRLYGSLVFEHHNKRHDADIDFVNVDNQGEIIWDSRFTQRITVDKQFFALTPRVGFQAYLTPQLVLEGFFGLGLRHRQVAHLNVNPSAIEDFDSEGWFWDVDFGSNRAETRFGSNWDLNLRFAWVF